MNKNILNFIFIVSSLFIISCGSVNTIRSTDVNENTIYSSFNASYDAENSLTEISAQFRVGGSSGTTVQLTQPSKIQVNLENNSIGKENFVDLNERSFMGTSYGINFSSSVYKSSYLFKWIHNDGFSFEKYEAKIPNPVFILSPLPGSFISKSTSFVTINFAYFDSATTFVRIYSSNSNGVYEISKSSSFGNATFSGSDLSRLPLGTAYIQVVNELNNPIYTAGVKSGQVSTKYYSKRVPIVVVN